MIKSRQDILEKSIYQNWCSLIAWLLNCDEAYFMSNPKITTAKDIWESSPNGELMFISHSISFLQEILKTFTTAKDLGELEDLTSRMIEVLDGNTIEVDKKYATGFGLKCRTLLWTCSEEFEEKVNNILIANWGFKND